MDEYRKGFCVEMVTSGCKCQPLSVYESDYLGANDFHNMTEGLGLHGVGGDIDNEGVCPKCQQPVVYNRYLVVTEVPPKTPTLADAAPEMLDALRLAADALDLAQAQVDSENDRYNLCKRLVAVKRVIAKAEGRDE